MCSARSAPIGCFRPATLDRMCRVPTTPHTKTSRPPGPGAIDPRRPDPLLSGYKMIRWDGYSIYHAGTFKIEKRLSRGLTFDANYTWSKSIDDASDVGTTFSETNIPQDVRNVRAERALSSFDHRHRLVFSYSYQLPFERGGRLLKDWTIT